MLMTVRERGADIGSMLPWHPGVQEPPRLQWGFEATPLVRALGGRSPTKDVRYVVLEKWCDIWELWKVRPKLLPAAILPI